MSWLAARSLSCGVLLGMASWISCAKPSAVPPPETPLAAPSASAGLQTIVVPDAGTVVTVFPKQAHRTPAELDRRGWSEIFGLRELPQVAPQNDVTVLINMAAIRQHPVGARTGAIFSAHPGWAGFLGGDSATLQPLRDAEWVLAYGSSFDPSDRTIVLARLGVSDTVLDGAMDAAASRYNQGSLDARVPGVKATLGYSSGHPRGLLRGQPHVLAVVPPPLANNVAKVLVGKPLDPTLKPGEAMRLLVLEPSRHTLVPGYELPKEIRSLQVWTLLYDDGTAELFAEGFCVRREDASTAAAALTQLIKRINSGLVSMMTGHVLGGAKIEVDDKLVRLHIEASHAQVERLVGLAATFMGVELQP